jgi:hypothetical protein
LATSTVGCATNHACGLGKYAIRIASIAARKTCDAIAACSSGSSTASPGVTSTSNTAAPLPASDPVRLATPVAAGASPRAFRTATRRPADALKQSSNARASAIDSPLTSTSATTFCGPACAASTTSQSFKAITSLRARPARDATMYMGWSVVTLWGTGRTKRPWATSGSTIRRQPRAMPRPSSAACSTME